MAMLAADLSLDLDNKWSYMKTHGDSGWEELPTYLPTVIPHFLDILRRQELKMTVFVVGQDTEVDENLPALKMIEADGHEIGNHSFHHEPWLQRYSREQLIDEFDRAEAAIAKVTTQPLRGFRGPGYSLSADVLDILYERGYQYDCSTFPTFLGPIARAYYFFNSRLSGEQVEDRKQLFGSVWDGFRRLKPYRWRTSGGELLELPVTTMPFTRAPFHFSYLLYLAQYSKVLATVYFRLALTLCKLSRTSPSLLLHPLDFLGGDEVTELAFFPAMNLPGEEKRRFCESMLTLYTRSFEVSTMGERAEKLAGKQLPVRTYTR